MIKLTAKHYQGVAHPYRKTWPKYATQLMNIAGQNSKATNPKNIGSIKETWLQMRNQGTKGTLQNWTDFYNQKFGEEVLINAGTRIHNMLLKMGIEWIDQDMCIEYTKEIVYNKTHMGMAGEEMALEATAKYFDLPLRYSTTQEESQGIDGWIGDFPVQVKKEGGLHKAHVHNHADESLTLVITYEEKKNVCYIHNPEFIKYT